MKIIVLHFSNFLCPFDEHSRRIDGQSKPVFCSLNPNDRGLFLISKSETYCLRSAIKIAETHEWSKLVTIFICEFGSEFENSPLSVLSSDLCCGFWYETQAMSSRAWLLVQNFWDPRFWCLSSQGLSSRIRVHRVQDCLVKTPLTEEFRQRKASFSTISERLKFRRPLDSCRLTQALCESPESASSD